MHFPIPDNIAAYIGVAIIAIAASYYFFVKILPALQGRPSPVKETSDNDNDDDENAADEDGDEDHEDEDDGTIFFDDDGTLTPQQYRKIALGAIFSEHQKAWINTLATGNPKKEIRKTLGDWWSITGPDEAVATLDYLRDKGYRYYFPVVLRIHRMPAQEQAQIAAATYGRDTEDYNKALAQAAALAATTQDLQDDDVIKAPADIAKYGVTAWDCGRLVYVARMCCDMRFITEEQAWRYIDAADTLARRAFSSWTPYAKSYVIGRALWAGTEYDNTDIAEIADYLLEDENSPWVQLPW